MPLESAHSWGLNRAIFVAAARRGFKGGGSKTGKSSGGASPEEGTYALGDDMAYRAPGKKLFFTIGSEVQDEAAFEKQVKARFGGYFPKAWKEALDYVKGFDQQTLKSKEDFFAVVYRPRRDELADAWTEAVETSA